MDSLFHQDVLVASLASGSRGNCTFIGDERVGVLVDCGLSTKQVLLRLDALGLGETQIAGVLVTHEHTDHVGAARVLSAKLTERQGVAVPFYLTRGTAGALDARCTPTRIEPVVGGRPFRLGAFTIAPTSVPHDTVDPVAYLVGYRGVNVCVLTDLGRVTRLVEQMVHAAHVAVVEFNHDVDMLLEGRYPWRLKQRVRGPHGHLSNVEAAALITAAASPDLAHLVLAHLSDENNRPELAFEAASAALAAAGRTKTKVSVATQEVATGPFRIQPFQISPSQAGISQARPRVTPRRVPVLPPELRQLPLFVAG